MLMLSRAGVHQEHVDMLNNRLKLLINSGVFISRVDFKLPF